MQRLAILQHRFRRDADQSDRAYDPPVAIRKLAGRVVSIERPGDAKLRHRSRGVRKGVEQAPDRSGAEEPDNRFESVRLSHRALSAREPENVQTIWGVPLIFTRW